MPGELNVTTIQGFCKAFELVFELVGPGLSFMHKDLHDHDLHGPCAAGNAPYAAARRRHKSRHLPATARKNLLHDHAVKRLYAYT